MLLPSSVLNLTNWYLTLPIGEVRNAEEIHQPQLALYSLPPDFEVNPSGTGVIFQAPVGGVTTKGSTYPRTELREMTDNGLKEASWTNKSGTNILNVREAITILPPVKSQVVSAQIHNSSSDVIEVMADGLKIKGKVVLAVRLSGSEQSTYLDNNYILGTPFNLEINASSKQIMIYYNGVLKFDFKKNGSGWYFKAGSYVQSNPSKGDSPTSVGQVVIYGLSVVH
jgi:hypothetical protein